MYSYYSETRGFMYSQASRDVLSSISKRATGVPNVSLPKILLKSDLFTCLGSPTTLFLKGGGAGRRDREMSDFPIISVSRGKLRDYLSKLAQRNSSSRQFISYDNLLALLSESKVPVRFHDLMICLIARESNFELTAMNPKGAKGLMQVVPSMSGPGIATTAKNYKTHLKSLNWSFDQIVARIKTIDGASLDVLNPSHLYAFVLFYFCHMHPVAGPRSLSEDRYFTPTADKRADGKRYSLLKDESNWDMAFAKVLRFNSGKTITVYDKTILVSQILKFPFVTGTPVSSAFSEAVFISFDNTGDRDDICYSFNANIVSPVKADPYSILVISDGSVVRFPTTPDQSLSLTEYVQGVKARESSFSEDKFAHPTTVRQLVNQYTARKADAFISQAVHRSTKLILNVGGGAVIDRFRRQNPIGSVDQFIGFHKAGLVMTIKDRLSEPAIRDYIARTYSSPLTMREIGLLLDQAYAQTSRLGIFGSVSNRSDGEPAAGSLSEIDIWLAIHGDLTVSATNSLLERFAMTMIHRENSLQYTKDTKLKGKDLVMHYDTIPFPASLLITPVHAVTRDEERQVLEAVRRMTVYFSSVDNLIQGSYAQFANMISHTKNLTVNLQSDLLKNLCTQLDHLDVQAPRTTSSLVSQKGKFNAPYIRTVVDTGDTPSKNGNLLRFILGMPKVDVKPIAQSERTNVPR
jgi:hypothetical protein